VILKRAALFSIILVTQQAFADLSLSAAPLGQPYYVVGEEGKCYWGKFSKVNGITALNVDYQSSVSSEHCVYQAIFAPKPSGYSIFVKEGGQCIPSHVDVEGESFEWAFKQDGPKVPFETCFRGLTSYGDNIDRKHKALQPTIAAVEKPVMVEVRPDRQVKGEATEAARGPSSLEPSYTLQLASYFSQEEARRAILGLKGKGVDAFAFSSKVNGSKHYRVCTGHFPKAKAARDFQAQLAKDTGITEGFVQVLPKTLEQGGAEPLK
jgi:septal ring-binding cell division protein DamX